MAYTRVAREAGTLRVPLSTAEKRIRDGKGRTPIDVSVTVTWTVSPDDWAVAAGEDDMTVAAVREAVRTEIENGAYPPPDREQIIEFDVRVARTPRALNGGA